MATTNVRNDIALWAVERLESNMQYLRECFALGRPEEFENVLVNPPSAAVIITSTNNSEVEAPPGEEYVYFTVEVWFAANRFRVDDSEAGLTDEQGVYEMCDDIHAAFKSTLSDPVVPTSCDEPLRYQSGEVTDVDDSYVIAYVDYRTARLI